MNPEVSIVIPTYNESESIIKLVSTIHNVCKKISHEIIIVDDHSPDQTARLLVHRFRQSPWFKCFLHPGRRGLGHSIGYGVAKARGRIIIGMDADGNHAPQIIPDMIRALMSCDMVVASRFLPEGGMPDRKRYLGSLWFNRLLAYMLRFPITDNTSGYYAIARASLLRLRPNSIYYGYGDYHLRLVWHARKAGLNIQEIPVFYAARIGGTSKSRLLRMLVSYLGEALRLSVLS